LSLFIVKAIPPNCPEKAVTEEIFFGNHIANAVRLAARLLEEQRAKAA
jgi:hypothetical protein